MHALTNTRDYARTRLRMHALTHALTHTGAYAYVTKSGSNTQFVLIQNGYVACVIA